MNGDKRTVFIAECADGNLFASTTMDAVDAVARLNTGHNRSHYTAKRLPVALVWSREFASYEDADYAYLMVRSWSRAKKRDLINGNQRTTAQLLRNTAVAA